MSNMPKLRFKEFNDEWELKKLELLCSKISDGIHSTPVYDENGEYYFINGNNLKKGVIILDEKTKRVSKEEYQKHFRELNNTTILMSINGTIGNIAFYNNEKAMLGKSACYININDNKTNKYFISNQVSSTKIQYYYISELTGSTIKNLSLKTIKNTPINLPSKQEQEKIASFLNQVDTKIEQLTKKEKLLQQYKKGVMQKIFNQEIRFVSDDGSEFCEWEEKNGNEIFETISNKNHNSDLPILAISQEFGAIPRDMIDYKITVTEKSVSSYKVVSIGDFIISLRSFQGGIEYSSYKGICSPAYIILRPFIEINNDFFRLYFKMDRYIQQLNSKLEGIRDGKMISYKYFSEIKLPFPCIEEQTKIANFLSSIDTKIEQTQKQLEKTKEFKKALLQQMFV